LLHYIVRIVIFYFIFAAFGCFNIDKTPAAGIVTSSAFLIKGICLVAPVTPIDSTALQPIVNIYANSIAVMPYAFCNPENPVIRFNNKKGWWGESDEGVINCIKLARQKNLTVMLKPHLWIGRGLYTGAFTLPTEKGWKIWEESYQNYILHFAKIADSMKAEIFCIGTELGESIRQRPEFWNSFIDTIKKTFRGKLTYAANWDDYKNFPFWQKLDYIGVDAYFPLINDKKPDVIGLKKEWSKYSSELEKISTQYKRAVMFTEYGYRNVDYNAAEPWKENEGNQNDEAQVNAYEAFYQTFAAKKWFAGGFVWKWYLNEGRHRRSEIDYTPQNKPAAKVIEKWYGN
jgi:hypothetical protein